MSICMVIHSCKTVFSLGLNILKLKFQVHMQCKIIPKNGSAGKESACNTGDTGDSGWIPGSRRFPGGGDGNPLQYSWLDNPMDRGAWRVTDHRVSRSQTWLKWHSNSRCTLKLILKTVYIECLNVKNYINWIIISGSILCNFISLSYICL